MEIKQIFRCRHCNKELTDILAVCNCRKKIKWNYPNRNRKLLRCQ